jgi:hypothetical protein
MLNLPYRKKTFGLWRRYFFVLTELDIDSLYYKLSESDSTFSGVISLQNANLELLDALKYTFQITTANGKKIQLASDSEIMMVEWMISIKVGNYYSIPSFIMPCL